MSDRFEDHRGVIQDVLTGPIDSVTRITTVAGGVRGNHVHKQTIQWTLVLTGRLLMAHGDTEEIVGPGRLIPSAPGVPHAWRALEDTDCLVFTKGPRAGENYESDTQRLDEPLIEDDPAVALEALRPSITTRRGLNDNFLRRVASVHGALVASGASHPITALAAAHGINKSTASRWVSASRKRGFM